MNQKFNKSSNIIFLLASIYYLSDALMPIMQFSSIIYLNALAVLIILYHFLINRFSFSSIKYFLPFSLILLFELLNYLVNAKTSIEYIGSIYIMTLFALPAFLTFYLFINNFQRTIRNVIVVSIIFLLITVISSIYTLQVDSNAARAIAVGNLDTDILNYYYKRNLGGFTIVYMIPIILPMIIAAKIVKRINIITMLLIIILFIYYTYLSQFSLALLLLLISFLSLLIAHNYSLKKLLTYFLLSIAFFFFSKPLIGNILYTLADLNESPTVSTRLNALGDTMLGMGSNVDAYTMRLEKYQMSIDAFLSSPLFGVFFNNTKVGEHSFILDELAFFGLLGLVALIFFYRQIYKFLYKPFINERFYGYMIWSYLMSIMLAFVNPTSSIFAICLVVPLIAYGIQDKRYVVVNNEGKLI